MTKRILILIVAVSSFVIAFRSNSLAESLPIFGPAKYSRITGVPNLFSDIFRSCNAGATYKVVIENGEAGKNRISSGAISLNGQEIVNQRDFPQKVDMIEKVVSLQAENTISVKLASGPNCFIKVNVYCVTNCLEVKITSPVTGNTINKSKTIIRGDLYNAFGETGVVLQSSGTIGNVSSATQTQETSFAGMISLQQGQNTITATATDACGYKTTDNVTINTQTLDEKIRLTANPESGISTLDVTLEAEAYFPIAISGYSWDINGDGTPDKAGPALARITAQYEIPGLYFPKVTISDTAGNTFSETVLVNVLSREEMNVLLKGKWDGMRASLVNGNIDSALLRYYAKESQGEYRQIFQFLSPQLPSLVSAMQEITMIGINGNVAEYYVKRRQKEMDISYFIYFIRDENGIWKIRDF